MRMFYLFRVFVQDRSDYDNDPDEWVSFDSVYVVADSALHDSDILQYQHREIIARNELQKIATRKTFRAALDKNSNRDTLRALFLIRQQELVVATDIELYEYEDGQGKGAATLLSSIAFNSIITGHSIDSSSNYEFRFRIEGNVDLRDASDVSGPPWMAETEALVGHSLPSAGKGLQLAAAFTEIKDSSARNEVVGKYSESQGSFSTRAWRKVSSVRIRFWIEAGLATLSGFLGLLTLFTRDWIEALTGFDPDNRDGSFEWAIIGALFLVCVLSSLAARADWRRLNSFAQAGI